LYTPESILFPYFPRISARFRVENEQRTTQEDEHHAPGRGLYGLATKRKDRPGSSLDHLSKKLSVLINFSNMRAKSWGTPARIDYTYPVSDLPVDKSGRICEKQKISGSV
jgi:hypothetical protein